MKQVLLENEHAEVCLYPEMNLGMITLKGQVTSEKYKEAFEILIQHGKKRRSIYYFLSDIRKQGVVGTENRKWFETVALPSAVDEG